MSDTQLPNETYSLVAKIVQEILVLNSSESIADEQDAPVSYSTPPIPNKSSAL